LCFASWYPENSIIQESKRRQMSVVKFPLNTIPSHSYRHSITDRPDWCTHYHSLPLSTFRILFPLLMSRQKFSSYNIRISPKARHLQHVLRYYKQSWQFQFHPAEFEFWHNHFKIVRLRFSNKRANFINRKQQTQYHVE